MVIIKWLFGGFQGCSLTRPHHYSFSPLYNRVLPFYTKLLPEMSVICNGDCILLLPRCDFLISMKPMSTSTLRHANTLRFIIRRFTNSVILLRSGRHLLGGLTTSTLQFRPVFVRFHGFGPLNKSPKGRRFNFNVEFAVRNGCANSSKDFTGRKFVEQKKLYSFYAYLILKK